MMNINDPEDYNDGYYHISKDINNYPEADIIIVWSPRGPGKTYSTLRYPYHKFKTIYMKRTKKDVQTICKSHENGNKKDLKFDPSPWSPLNRDFNLRVKGTLLLDGIGAFYDTDEKGEPIGDIINYVAALNTIKDIKGIDLSDVEWMIIDEFIPLKGEVVRRDEGEMMLDIYETISRDRLERGRPPLKLILMANAEEISTPITNALNVVDIMAWMQATKTNIYYDEKRGILLHHLTAEEFPVTKHRSESMRGLARAMEGTAWFEKSYGGDFASNDFSNVVDKSLKHMRCMYHLHYRRKNDAYIYLDVRNGSYYMTDIKGPAIAHYDLDKENHQKKFYFDHGMDLKEACIEDRFKFKKYSYYDLIINYTKIYDL